MAIMDCRADVYANGHKFTVRAVTLPPNGDKIEVELNGVDIGGEESAKGSMTLPPNGLAAVGKLMHQVMTGLSTLNGRSAATAPANAQSPWTKEQDDELLERWLAAGDTYSATRVRRDLADHFGRTTGAIRARLLRIGCDPDAPGHAFLPQPEQS